jgi:YVTN family beta-propeller protein
MVWGDHDHDHVEAVATPLTGHPPPWFTYGLSWLGYDALHRQFYVGDPPSSVDIVPGNFTPTDLSPSRVVPVGLDPFGVAFDNATGEVFVTNTGSNNVSVLSGNDSAPVDTIGVGSEPMGISYDPTNGNLYVANNGSDNVSVISGTRLSVVATIPVGVAPLGVAADPASGQVYVADSGSSEISVIAAATRQVVANLSVGLGPYGIAIDSASDTVYVTNSISNNLTVFAGSTDSILDWISLPSGSPSPPGPVTGLAYDAADGLVWVGAGPEDLIVLNTSTQTVEADLGTDPAGVVYDPDTGDVCVTNTFNRTFECLLSQVTFSETGLPAGASWTAEVSPGLPATPRSSADFTAWIPCLTTDNFTIPNAGGYSPSPDSGTIASPAYWGELTLPIVFTASGSLYPLTFVETGLPGGTNWSVDAGGVGEASTTSRIPFSVPNETYAFTVGEVPGYSISSASGNVTVAGAPVTEYLTFSPIPPSYPVIFVESGLPHLTYWSVNFPPTIERRNGTQIEFNESNGTYAYNVSGPVDYEANPTNGRVLVQGGTVSVPIAFVLANVSYPVTLRENGLPTATNWSVDFAGIIETTRTTTLVYDEPNGTYPYDASTDAGFSANGSIGQITVAGGPATVVFNFTSVVVPIDFTETGLPSGSHWSVTATDQEMGSTRSANGTTASITLFLVYGSYSIRAQAASGDPMGIYTSVLEVGPGPPVAVSVPFGPSACTCGESAALPSPVTSYLEGGVVGLLGALAAVAFIVRSRRPPFVPPESR